MNLAELKKQREAALNKAESFVAAAENANRNMTAQEVTDVNAAMAEVTALDPQIKAIEQMNTLRAVAPGGRVLAEAGDTNPDDAQTVRRFSKEYRKEYTAWLRSRGRVVGASMSAGFDSDGGFAFPAEGKRVATSYEGSNAAGGYAVPSQLSGEFVPLAPPEMGAYSLVSVVPTTMDTRYVRKAAHGTAAVKAESGGSTNNFAGSDPSIEQFTLSAFMMGHIADASFELLQDVGQFQGFLTDDILLSLATLRENWIVNGSGSGQAQGIVGNTAAGATGVLVGSDNYASELLDATLDVQGSLNAVYHSNAKYLMHRATSILFRKAQKTANLFEQVFVRINGTDYLHGYEVAYSSAMPVVAAAATPIIFGDFKAGYIYGERGGAGVNVKILDQTKAASGLVEVLGYQRVDGRIRRSEALQAVTLHA